MNKKTRLKRFHKNIFFPEWSDRALKVYRDGLVKEGKITFSVHALEKLIIYTLDYGKVLSQALIDAIRKKSKNGFEFFNTKNVFEFYSVGETIKKACYRHSFGEIPVDLILVISSEGVVITAYVTGKNDKHTTLNKNLYERSS